MSATQCSTARSGQVERWLLDEIAARTGVRPTRAYREATFQELGLDSAASVELAGGLASLLDLEISETLLFEHPTVGELLTCMEQMATDGPVESPLARIRRVAEPTAITGMALRLPGAEDLGGLWELMASERDAIGAPPFGRDAAPVDVDPELLRGGYVDHVDEFDSLFFGISPRDAATMDPQHRILMELAWEAMERAGTTLRELRDVRTGVFIGISSHDSAMRAAAQGARMDRFVALGVAASMAASRISHALGTSGPAMSVDTACSSALVALHLAHRSLQDGECDVAIVGGVNLLLWPQTTMALAKAGLLSATGRCLPFDERADGFVRGEGAGVILVQRAEDATRWDDRPLALIHGSAVNSNGRTNGVLAPKLAAMRDVLTDAYARAGISPANVSYVEAQATGSRVGDAIEAKALGSVLGQDRPLERVCAMGSVKGNTGHLEAASGMAGLACVLACSEREELVPVHGFREPSRAIAFDALPVEVPRSRSPWPSDGPARIAGLSASGLGGTNAHVVLELP